MKRKIDYENVRGKLTQLLPLIIAAGIFFLFIHYWEIVEDLIATLVAAAKPIIIGLVIAYLINILMVAFERLLKKVIKKPGPRRITSMITSLAVIVTALTAIIMLVVPQFIDGIGTLVQQAPAAIDNITNTEFVKDHLSSEISSALESIDWSDLVSRVEIVLTSGLSSGVSQVMTGFSIVVNLVLGLIFALYLLTGKERLLSQLRRVLRTYMKPGLFEKTYDFCHRLNENCRNFVSGKCIDAVIIGTMCGLGMALLGLPYATMIGTLVGFMALIPVAGSYVGAAIGFVMIASVSLSQSLVFLVFIILLQQFEGNLIYPKIVGSSVGLSGIWVLAAVTVFGALLGIPGMFIGVPITSTIYQLVQADLHRREEKPPIDLSAAKSVEHEEKNT